MASLVTLFSQEKIVYFPFGKYKSFRKIKFSNYPLRTKRTSSPNVHYFYFLKLFIIVFVGQPRLVSYLFPRLRCQNLYEQGHQTV
jgi:hypothetical protein